MADIYDVNGTPQHAHISWMCRCLEYRDGLLGLFSFKVFELRSTAEVNVSMRTILGVGYSACVGFLTIILFVSLGGAACRYALHNFEGRMSPVNKGVVSTVRGRTRYVGWILYLLFFFGGLWVCSASEDERVRRALQLRAHVQMPQQPTGFQGRWDWSSRHFGLTIPPVNGEYDGAAHRVDADPMKSPTTIHFEARHRNDPLWILRRFSDAWEDVEDYTLHRVSWSLYEGHLSVRRSAVLQAGCRHYLLLTHAETQTLPQDAAVFLEVHWRGHVTEDYSLSRPWLPSRTSILQIFDRVGILTACTSTHRCDIEVNGQLQHGPGILLGIADFVQIETFIFTPTISDDEEEYAEPIAGIRSPSTSSATSSSSTLSESTSASGSFVASNTALTCMVHIYRPRLVSGRPLHVYALIARGSRTWRSSVFEAWPPLRYGVWDHADVHRSIHADFPSPDDIRYKVIIAPADLGEAKVVPLAVVCWGDYVFHQALAIHEFSTPGHVYAALSLLPWCGPLHEHCTAWLNGFYWSPALQEHLRHGSYIRIRIRQTPVPGLGAHLALVFQEDDELHDWTGVDATGIARLGGDLGGASSMTMGPFPVPQTTLTSTMTDWYWIFIGLLMSCGMFPLLCTLCQLERRLPPAARSVGGQRRKTMERRLWSPSFAKTYLMLFLTVSQPPLGESLQLFHVEPGLHAQHVPLTSTGLLKGGSYGLPIADGPPIQIGVDPCLHLPPPGNPIGNWLHEHLTPHGKTTLTLLDTFCGLQLLSRPFHGRPDPTAELRDLDFHGPLCQPTLDFSRPVATPARAAFCRPLATGCSHDAQFSIGQREHSPAPVREIALADLLDFPSEEATNKPDYFSLTEGADTSNCHFPCTDQDLADLFEAWEPPPTPALPDASTAPTCLQEILSHSFGQYMVADQIEIYTDGSHGPPTSEASALTTWAFVILGNFQGQWKVCEWFGDFLELDPLAPAWCGAQTDTIMEGEANALLFSYLWILQCDRNIDVPIFSNSYLAINVSTGCFNVRSEDTMMIRARATYYVLQMVAYRTGRYHVAHVRSHQGNIGNEIADLIATQIRSGALPPRPVPRHFASWFHGTPPKILYAGMVMDFTVRPHILPQLVDSSLEFPPDLPPAEPPEWLPRLPKPGAVDATPTPSLLLATYNVHTLRAAGRAAYLREQLQQKGIFMLGLQETRCKDSSTFDSSFLRFCSPACKGQGGTELWISRVLPFALVEGQPQYITRDAVQILHMDPECLIAEVSLGKLAIVCVVGHAPHKGHDAITIKQWWHHLSSLTSQFRQSRPILAFLDANAAVEEALPHFGNVDVQEWDTAGRELLKFCQQHCLFAPSTHAQWHHGSSTTWTSSKAGALGARNDYIIVDLQWQSWCNGSWTDTFIDAGHQMLDHSAAILSITTETKFKVTTRLRPQFDRNKILQATSDVWERFYADFPHIPWSTEVTTHARQIEDYLHQRLAQFFPKDPIKRRNSVFQDRTWDLYLQKSRCKKLLTQCRRTIESWQVAVAWAILKGTDPLRGQVAIILSILRTCRRLGDYRGLCTDLASSIRQDRALFADGLLDALHRSPGKKAVQLLKPLRLGKRHRTMGLKAAPMVRLESGEIASSRASAMERWRRHFGEMEGGLPTTQAQLWSQCRDAADAEDISMTASDIPTVFELEHQLRRAATGKACGVDEIPGELLHSSCTHLAMHLWPLLLKMCSRLSEPLQYKGGKLVALFKNKGSPMECSSYRAILVSSPVGKSLHNVFRARVVPYLQDAATSLQYSSQQGAMVAMAAHTIRLAQGRAKRLCRSDSTIFLDIASAYYTLLRQHAVDLSLNDEDLICFLHRMKIPDPHIESVARMLQGVPAFQDLGIPDHLHRMVAQFHQGTWFALSGDHELTNTTRGTRPGDGFADILWAVTFNRFLKDIEAKIQSTQAFYETPWNGQIGLLTGPGDVRVPGACVTWADDIACFGMEREEGTIVPSTQCVASILFSELDSMGLAPNMSRGKTELILTPRGKHKTTTRQFLHHRCQGQLYVDEGGPSARQLRIVAHYPHLGGQISHCGRMRGEVRRRLAIAKQSMKDLAPKVYHNKLVSLDTRLAIFRATTWPALMYNTGTWLPLTKLEQQMWYSGTMKLYRGVLSKIFSFEELCHLPDGRILDITSLPHPEDALRLSRLRYFGQALSRGNPNLWSLIAEEQTWLTSVREDFDWLFQQIVGLTRMPPPAESPEEWHQEILNHYPRWKGLLKRVECHAQLQRGLRYDVQSFHRQLITTLRRSGLCRPPEQGPTAETTDRRHRCIICKRTFASKCAWGSHSFKVHQRINPCRTLQAGDTCRACGRKYPSHERLIRHLRTTPSCQQSVASLRLWTAPQPYYGNTIVREREPTDSMIPWQQTAEDIISPVAATALTEAGFQALRWTSLVDWALADEQTVDHTVHQLCTLPLHWEEFEHIITAQKAFYADLAPIPSLLELEQAMKEIYFPAEENPFTQEAANDDAEWMERSDDLRYVDFTPSPRRSSRMLYVLHLFSGVRRTNDLHSAVASMPAPPAGILCPISIDVVLDASCDLMQDSVQKFWLSCAADGFLFMVVAGPPCETWSVSRLRRLIEGHGPRPLRDSTNDFLLWGLAVLRIREIKQLRIGNRLLQFCLVLAAAQAAVANFFVLEHPQASGLRHGILPASIWRLKSTQLLLRHPLATIFHIRQGLFGGLSPKPTSLLMICPPCLWPIVESILFCGRTNIRCPPPIQMGRADGQTGYRTAPLKRYPGPLCRTIARLSYAFAEKAQVCGGDHDPVHELAEKLEALYQRSTEGATDGADYHHASQ